MLDPTRIEGISDQPTERLLRDGAAFLHQQAKSSDLPDDIANRDAVIEELERLLNEWGT